jgi:amidase
MVSMIRDGVISPSELLEAHLRQIELRNPSLNAFVFVRAGEARAEARRAEAQIARREPLGMLHGIPVTVKDSFDVAGLPTRAGSRFRPPVPAAHDAAVVSRLREEGAIVLGKTNTPEMLASYETDNFLTGRTNNPWDLERTPGGSSGGEAAAIAACCSPGGIGTDGGGSIRVPAHFCGIAGLKPTPGRIPTSGHFPALGYPGGLWSVAGPMARNATDLRLLFSVLAGYDAKDPFSVPVPLRVPAVTPLRIGVWEQFYSVPANSEVRAAVCRAAALLGGPGREVLEFTPRGLERAPNIWASLFAEWTAPLTRKLIEGRESEAHWTLLEFLPSSSLSGEEVLLSLAARDRIRAALLRQLDEIPVLLMPVAGISAFHHGERSWRVADHEIGLFQAMMPAVIANILGLPAVTVPVGVSAAGLPIGIQLVGRPFEDELLLELAIALEESRGPFPAPPQTKAAR